MIPYQDLVKDFHRTFKCTMPEKPTLHPLWTSCENERFHKLRIAILQEEIDELDVAMRQADIVEVADALADILYLAFGTAVAFGVQTRVYEARIRTGYLKIPAQKYHICLQQGVERLEAALAQDNIDDVSSAIDNIVYLVFEAAGDARLNIEPIFMEVHRSNMSKLDEDGNPIFRGDGKVIKSRLYSPPNLTPIIEAQANGR